MACARYQSPGEEAQDLVPVVIQNMSCLEQQPCQTVRRSCVQAKRPDMDIMVSGGQIVDAIVKLLQDEEAAQAWS